MRHKLNFSLHVFIGNGPTTHLEVVSDVFSLIVSVSCFVVIEQKDTEETWETLRAGLLSAKWSPEQLFSLRLVELIDF